LGGATDAEYKRQHFAVARFSSWLTSANPATVDISPGARGNNPLGTNDGTGHPLNPVTGLPYPPQTVNRGDFGRVLGRVLGGWA
jgi:hypothetical protein